MPSSQDWRRKYLGCRCERSHDNERNDTAGDAVGSEAARATWTGENTPCIQAMAAEGHIEQKHGQRDQETDERTVQMSE